MSGYVGADYLHRGEYFADAANIASSGAAELVNARIGMRKDKYTVELFGRNVFNDQSPGITYNGLAPGLVGGNTLRVALPDQRRIGVRVSASF